nr:hypothetical protein [Tanacetum cinerariifolium]
CPKHQLWPLEPIHAYAAGICGRKVLAGHVVGERAHVADELVAAGFELHEGVDVGSTSPASWRSCLAKV